jgi:hypothetical protein
LNKLYKPPRASFNSERKCAETIEAALDDLVGRIAATQGGQGTADSTLYTFGEIDKNIMTDWSICPIFHRTVFNDGVYRSFDDFRNDRLSSPDSLRILMDLDSTYSLFLPLSIKRHAKKSPDSLVYKHYTYPDLWAVSYNNAMYIRVGEGYYLPLNQGGNSFYFHIPYSLPNMDLMKFDLSNTVQPPDLNAGGSDNIWAALIVVAISESFYGVALHKAKKRREAVAASMKNDEMRDCALNMDTGEIICH